MTRPRTHDPLRDRLLPHCPRCAAPVVSVDQYDAEMNTWTCTRCAATWSPDRLPESTS